MKVVGVFSPANVGVGSIQGYRNSMCKGPEAGAYLRHLGSSNPRARVPEMEIISGDEVPGNGDQILWGLAAIVRMWSLLGAFLQDGIV